MTQYFIRRRKLALRTKTRLVGVKKKVERREISREKKAHNAAKLETAIEKELLERLRSGAYGDIYNFPQAQYEKALDEEMDGEQFEEEEEEVSGDEYEAQYEDDSGSEGLVDVEEGGGALNGTEYDFDDSSDEDESSGDDNEEGDDGADKANIEDLVRARAKKRASAKKKRPTGKGRKALRHRGGVRVEMEYEHETEQRSAQLMEQ